MTTYYLGVTQIDQSSLPATEKNHNFEFTEKLSEKQYKELSKSIITISRFLGDSEIFNITALNYIDLFDLIENYLLAYRNKKVDIFIEKPINININRSFLNFLSSTRSYLDFMDRLLKKRYSEDSEIYKNFVMYTNEEYDSNFSYRFLYNLRHYAQHKGFPIGSIKWGQKPMMNCPQKPDYYLDVSILRNEILIDFEWKKLESEIRNLPEMIDPRIHVDAFMKSLRRIHIKVMFNIFSTLKDDANRILSYSKELLDKKGTPVLFETEDDISTMRKLQYIPIPIDIVRKIISGKFEGVFKP